MTGGIEELLLAHGLPALFLLSFLAATIVPLGSEWLLATLLLNSFPAGEVVVVATVGNYLGACTTYLIGIYGSDFFVRKILRMGHERISQIKELYGRYGSWSLLFSWLPVVGDPLCLVGGLFRLNFLIFSLFVFSGKCARYSLVAMVVLQI